METSVSNDQLSPKPSSSIASLLSAILSWPTFAVLLVLLFWTPLHQIAALLPKIVESSDTVTLGKVTFQVRQSLKILYNRAGPKVRDALAGMEAEDVMTVLENNLVSTNFYSGDIAEHVQKWQRLKRLGVIEELKEQELRAEERKEGKKKGEYEYAVRPTEKYDKLHKFLGLAVNEIVSMTESAQPSGEK
jgi:hypothetical protein